MACKDSSVAKKRILNKQHEFENIKRDIHSLLESLTETVTQAAQSVSDKSTVNHRKKFRAAYVNADQTIETCLLKLMEARAILQNEDDEETGSDPNEDVDNQNSISRDFIKLRRPSSAFSNVDSLISDNFSQNGRPLSAELKCESPTLLSSTQQPHYLANGPTKVVTTQGLVGCLNTDRNEEELDNCNSPLPYNEPKKQPESLPDFSNDCKMFQNCIAQGQQTSIREEQRNFLEQCDSPSAIDTDPTPLFDTFSGDSQSTITNSKLNGQDGLSSIQTGCGEKSVEPLIPNSSSKHAEVLIHQFKDFNLNELVNTLAHLTEPKNSGDNPETERFQKHVQNIYKHVAPNISGSIGKFSPSNFDQSLDTTAQFSPENNASEFNTTITGLPCNSVSNKPYNLEIASRNSAPTIPNIFGNVRPHASQKTQDKETPENNASNFNATITNLPCNSVFNKAPTIPNFFDNVMNRAGQKTQDKRNTKENVFDISGGNVVSQSFPLVNLDAPAVQERQFHAKVAPGFSPIVVSNDCFPRVSDTVTTAYEGKDNSLYPVDSESSYSAMSFSLPQFQFDKGSVIIATVEHVNSPSSFYIRPKNNDLTLEALTAQLSKWYDGSYLELFTDKPETGLACCALSYKDNTWYRAIINQIHRPISPGYVDGSVTVQFVDRGITETLPLFRLRRLNEAFYAIPCLVVHCTLHNAKHHVDQTQWDEEQIDTFSNLACRNDIKAVVHGKLSTGELDVDLISLQESDSETIEVSILDCFINAECCCGNISNAADEPEMTSPLLIDLQEQEENKNSKISFVIKSKKDTLSDKFKNKKTEVKKSKRQHRTSRAFADSSDSDNDKQIPAATLKPRTIMCWEDLDSHSGGGGSSVEKKKIEIDSSNKIIPKNVPTSSPFPTLCNIELNLSDFAYQDAILAHVVSPSEFYIHPVIEEATCIDKLSSDLNTTYAKAQAPLALVDKLSIPIGSFWCAKFPVNSMWYRAKVLDVKEIEDLTEKLSHESKKKKKKLKSKSSLLESKFKVHVFYVDYGDTAWIDSNDLRQLKNKFYKHPALAVRCSLMSVFPKRDPNIDKDESTPTWSPEAGKALQLWAGEKVIRIQIFSAEEYKKTGEYQVMLWDLENEECLFNEEIVKRGLADSNIYCKDGDEAVQKVENNGNDEIEKLSSWDPMTSDFQDLRNSYAVDVDDPGVALTGYKARDESEICMFYQRGQVCKRGSDCRYKHIKPSSDGQTTDLKAVMCSDDVVTLPTIGSWVAVDVTAILSPAHFYVNFPYSPESLWKLKEEANCEVKPECEKLTTLQTKLQNAYKGKFPRNGDYLLRAVGEVVVAKFSLDNEWYRARVTHVDSERCRVKVFYVDYGNCEWVSEIDIRDILPEFMHFPFQAIECRLANIELTTGDDEELKKQSMTFFQNQVENRKLVAQINDVIGNTLYLELYYTENETDFHINWALMNMDYAKYNSSKTNSRSPIRSKKVNIMPV